MDKRLEHGGTGPKLQLLHANGYPPECYNTFLEPLTRHHKVHSFRQRPLWSEDVPKSTRKWKLFAEDLIEMMDEYGDKGVIGLGHSLGGIATFMASLTRPDLFKEIVLIDPVIPPYWSVQLMTYTPNRYKSRILPLIKMAEKRRNKWSDREEARAHLGSKKVYQRFHPEVFDDFIESGLKESADGGLTLSYSREWEAEVYRNGPNIWPLLSKSTVPVHIIKAQYSDVITSNAWAKIKTKVSPGRFYEMPNVGHLIPFEKPHLLADYLINKL